MTQCLAENAETGTTHDVELGDGTTCCAECCAGLLRRLAGVPALLVDLDVTLTRQDRIGEPGPSIDGTLAWKPAVPDTVWALGNTLTVWAREIAERNGLEIADPQTRPIRGSAADHPVPTERTGAGVVRCEATGLRPDECACCRDLPHLQALPDDAVPARPQPVRRAPVLGQRPPTARDSIAIAARWLLAHAELLRRDPEAHAAHDEITAAIAQAEATCSAPPLRLYVGRCEACIEERLPHGVVRHWSCEEDLYCRPDFQAVTCPRCETTHSDMATRWDRALARVRLWPATAAVIAHHVGELYGVRIDRKLINQWHRREKISAVDHDEDGHPRFRIGAVLDLARRQQPARQAG